MRFWENVKSWFERHLSWMALTGLYGGLFLSSGFWISQKIKFSGVEEWPSVDAVILEHGSESFSTRTESNTDTRVGTRTVSWVLYEYEVEGKTFQSKLGRPDGGGIPTHLKSFKKEDGQSWDESWKAYYRPDQPEVAVLNPVPYRGRVWLVVTSMLGAIAVVQLYLWIDGFSLRTRWSQARKKTS